MSKFKLKQRFPNFMTGFTSETYNIDSIEDIEKAEFVKRWKANSKFVRFSLGSWISEKILMVELNDDSFWDIGWISKIENELSDFSDLDLPLWQNPTKKI